jgi:hypothetical protein
VLDRLGELFKVDGFADITVGPKVVGNGIT